MKKKIAVFSTSLYGIFMLYYVFIFNAVSFPNKNSFKELLFKRVNLVPFKSMVDYVFTLAHGRINSEYVIKFFFGNLIVLFPIGMAVVYFAKKNQVKKSALAGIFISLTMEAAQLLLRIGSFDIGCVILRTVGIMLGAVAMRYFISFSGKTICPDN